MVTAVSYHNGEHAFLRGKILICIAELEGVLRDLEADTQTPSCLEGDLASRGIGQERRRHWRSSRQPRAWRNRIILPWAMGWNLKDVQEWLGHSDIKMTANIYSHLDVARKTNIADSLAAKFQA
jgi:integrase